VCESYRDDKERERERETKRNVYGWQSKCMSEYMQVRMHVRLHKTNTQTSEEQRAHNTLVENAPTVLKDARIILEQLSMT
jgi:hypothetical protein